MADMYSYVWMCNVVYDYIWVCMVSMDMYGCVCSSMHVYVCMHVYEYVCRGVSGICPALAPEGPERGDGRYVWICMNV